MYTKIGINQPTSCPIFKWWLQARFQLNVSLDVCIILQFRLECLLLTVSFHFLPLWVFAHIRPYHLQFMFLYHLPPVDIGLGPHPLWRCGCLESLHNPLYILRCGASWSGNERHIFIQRSAVIQGLKVGPGSEVVLIFKPGSRIQGSFHGCRGVCDGQTRDHVT